MKECELSVAPNGIVYVRDFPDVKLRCIRKIRDTEVHWSSWYWLREITASLEQAGVPFSLSGKNHYERLSLLQQKIQTAIKDRLSLPEEKFNDVFRFPLWEIQRVAASVLILARRFYLGDPVGLGKTLSAFGAYALLRMSGRVQSLVIVCTASVKHQWKYEINNAIHPGLQDLFRSEVIEGTGNKSFRMFESPAPIKIVGYESFRIMCQKHGLPKKPDVLILDEAWKVMNRTAKVRRELKKFIQGIPYVFAANASLIRNGYEDLFSVIDLFDNRVFVGWENFEHRHVRYHPKHRYIKWYENVPDLKRRTSVATLRRSITELGTDFPKITATTYWIKLSKEQRKDYNQIKKDRKDDISLHVLARMACLSSQSVDPKDSPKYKELASFLTSVAHEEKVLVFCESRKYLEAILPLLKKQKVSCRLISGGVSTKARSSIQGAFQEGNVRVLLCTSAGEAGLNLQAADVVVNLDLPWTGGSLVQRVGRVRPYLGGSSRVIRVINILARNTIEERVMDKVLKKMGYFTAIFDEKEQVKLTGIFDQKVLRGLV